MFDDLETVLEKNDSGIKTVDPPSDERLQVLAKKAS